MSGKSIIILLYIANKITVYIRSKNKHDNISRRIMKKNIVLLYICLCLSSTLFADQSMQQNAANPNTISFQVILNNDNKPNNSIAIATIQETKTFSQQVTKLWNIHSPLPTEWQNKTTSFLKANKYKTMLFIVASVYAVLCYEVIKGYMYLNKENLWSSWRSTISFEELLAISQQQLSQELLRDIQLRYTNAQNINDFISPLATFLNDIEKETHYINYYNKLNTWLIRLHLSTIIPVSKKHFDGSKERLQRLAYLKNVFLSWATEYKIVTYQPKISGYIDKKATS